VALQAVDGVGLSPNSNLFLNGGVFQTVGPSGGTVSFTACWEPPTGQVQFGSSGGGFAAGAAKLFVNIGNGTPLAMGVGAFAGSTLILQFVPGALETSKCLMPINLGIGPRTFQVDDNTNTGFDFATISGVISGGAGGNINKTNGGNLILSGANTYVGSTTITGGFLTVRSIGAAGALSVT
jgi:autotransporter-associated beta strand protein